MLADPARPAATPAVGPWRWTAAKHRCNTLLWAEEDQARRTDVGAAAIAASGAAYFKV
jgi:hypothetical protein